MLNNTMDEVVLVKGWKKGASWSFPRGKINKDEKDLDCAIREVYEETGYDIGAAGLVPDAENVKAIDVTMREQHMRLFVFRNVPADTHFEPRTRKEISKIQWYKLTDLPAFKKKGSQIQSADIINANKFYMVAPFLVPLKKWINQQRKQDISQAAQQESQIAEEVTDFDLTSGSPLGVVDPAAELKRLLSVGASRDIPSVGPQAQDSQPNQLLAMLRGNGAGSLQPPQAVQNLPTTPLDQMTGFPADPQSPHRHNTHNPSQAMRQDPPSFPYINSNPKWLGPGSEFAVGQYVTDYSRHPVGVPPPIRPYGPPGSALMPQTPGFGQMRGPFPPNMQPSAFAPNDRERQLQQPFPPNMQPSAFTPNDQQGQLQHGPIAPKASQLPPPKLNSHTMNLLNAFKPSPAGATANLQAPGGSAPSLRSPFNADAQPRNQHQSSLLDLFRSPSAQHTQPAAQSMPSAAVPSQNEVAEPPPIAQFQQSEHAPTAQRKSSSIGMITRTLPRVRLDDPHQFPELGASRAKPSTKAILKSQSQMAQAPDQLPAPLAVDGHVKILSRPVSSTSKAREHTASPAATPSPAKQSPITILQRKSTSNSPDSPYRQKGIEQARMESEQASKPFQPQLLRRKRPEDEQESSAESGSIDIKTQGSGSQKDALLAMFAKNAQASSQSTKATSEEPSTSEVVSPSTVTPNIFVGATSAPRPKPASTGTSAWNNFATQAAVNASRPKVVAEQNKPNEGGVVQARWKETFKQTPIVANWTGGPRKVINVEKTIHGEQTPNDLPKEAPKEVSKEAVTGTPPAPVGSPFDEISRSRMGSRASVASGSTIGEGVKSPTTPLEARGFLLNFLDGVAKGGR